jgi:RNA polymerase sigma-70 factor (ECF subfamily)
MRPRLFVVQSKPPPGGPPRLTVVKPPVGGAPDGGGEPAPAARPLELRQVYETWFDHVVKWLYALGAPAADTEDLAQEIFLVVRRRLPEFDGGNMAGWLYRIAQLTVRDYRRRAWFKNLVLRRQQVELSEVPHAAAGPDRTYEHGERRRELQAVIARMSEKRRTTFVLFEIEGYTGEEIARIQDIPLATVWTRLHHARKDFWKIMKANEMAERGPR